jgi:hypothetical protein
MGFGSLVRPSDIVTAVRVRKTQVESCDPLIHSEVDVVFETADRLIKATVGHTPDGRWQVCPAY